MPDSQQLPENKLFSKSITPFDREQLNQFRKDNLHTQTIRSFNVNDLMNHNNQEVIAVDIGGNSIVSARYRVENGDVEMVGESEIFESENGNGYLQFLEQVAEKAKSDDLIVGISWAGQVISGNPTFGANVSQLTADLKEKYGGELKNLFSKYICDNDAVTGLIAGIVEAKKAYPNSANVLYVINGSGTGAAILKDNEIIAIEPGHVEAVGSLKNMQEKPCGVFGDYVCVENIAGGKAGIETIWEKKAGHKLGSDEISEMAQSHDALAIDIFDNSALAISYLVAGEGEAFELFGNQTDTVVIFHGGTFNFVQYCKRIEEILNHNLGFIPQILYTKEMHHNTCLHGAAIAAVLNLE